MQTIGERKEARANFLKKKGYNRRNTRSRQYTIYSKGNEEILHRNEENNDRF